uniref:Uncharacterized protein n=1 Tax=Cucumis melo TaxID=3656 RepID=A0A9I9CSS6_CUCME
MGLDLGYNICVITSSSSSSSFELPLRNMAIQEEEPLTMVPKFLSYGQKNLVFAHYGSYWRNVRKMCTLELFSNHKINSFKSTRKEEVGLLIEYLKEAASDGVSINISSKAASLSTDMTCLIVFGRKFGDEESDDRGSRL